MAYNVLIVDELVSTLISILSIGSGIIYYESINCEKECKKYPVEKSKGKSDAIL